MLDQEFNLKPSKYYIIFLSVVLLVSLGIVFCLSINHWLKGIGLLTLIIYGSHLLCRHGFLRSPSAVTQIRRLSNGDWLIKMGKAIHTAKLCGDSTVTGFASVLRFRKANYRWPVTCMVFPDSLDADQYRQLMVVLRLK